MSWQRCSGKVEAKMTQEEYQVHCEAMGKIIASAFDEKGLFNAIGAARAIDHYKRLVGLRSQ